MKRKPLDIKAQVNSKRSGEGDRRLTVVGNDGKERTLFLDPSTGRHDATGKGDFNLNGKSCGGTFQITSGKLMFYPTGENARIVRSRFGIPSGPIPFKVSYRDDYSS